MADRILVLRAGRLVAEFARDAVDQRGDDAGRGACASCHAVAMAMTIRRGRRSRRHR